MEIVVAVTQVYRDSMNPRDVANQMVQKMDEAAKEFWDSLSVKEELKPLVWSHVCNHYARKFTR